MCHCASEWMCSQNLYFTSLSARIETMERHWNSVERHYYVRQYRNICEPVATLKVYADQTPLSLNLTFQIAHKNVYALRSIHKKAFSQAGSTQRSRNFYSGDAIFVQTKQNIPRRFYETIYLVGVKCIPYTESHSFHFTSPNSDPNLDEWNRLGVWNIINIKFSNKSHFYFIFSFFVFQENWYCFHWNCAESIKMLIKIYAHWPYKYLFFGILMHSDPWSPHSKEYILFNIIF